jgi:hypothetical protein
MLNYTVYKYNKHNLIEFQVVKKISWLCNYKYSKHYRKAYFYTKGNLNQITKETLDKEYKNFKIISSLVFFKESKYYSIYSDGKEIYSKFFNKNKNSTFESETLLQIGNSYIKKYTLDKKGKKEKQIQIFTKSDGKR